MSWICLGPGRTDRCSWNGSSLAATTVEFKNCTLQNKKQKPHQSPTLEPEISENAFRRRLVCSLVRMQTRPLPMTEDSVLHPSSPTPDMPSSKLVPCWRHPSLPCRISVLLFLWEIHKWPHYSSCRSECQNTWCPWAIVIWKFMWTLKEVSWALFQWKRM